MVLLVNASMGEITVGIPLIGFFLTLLAALSWGLGNIVNKVILNNPAMQVTALSLVVWGASITMIAFFLCSWLFEDHAVIINSLKNIQLKMILVIVYLAFLSSIVGYGLWGYLLSRYATWRIAPLTLLVPIIGLASGVVVFNEKLSVLQIMAILLVMTGLLINVFGGWLSAKLRSIY